jgi:hypothetical protein
MGMTPKLIITLSCGIILLSACKESAYFQSPFQSNTSSYKTMLIAADSLKAASYVSGSFFGGGANQRWRDGLIGLTGSLHRSHVLGDFRAFYGVNGTIGGYNVKPLHKDAFLDYAYPNDSVIYARRGRKFFGGLGAIGGIYVTHTFDNGGEWNIIGTELSYQYEFGDYYSFRKNLPEDAANMNSKHRDFITLGFHSDIKLRTHTGTVGLKLGAVFSTRPETVNYGPGYSSDRTTGYFSSTWHFTRDRFTGFWQNNIGTWTFVTLFGINYRL